MERSSNKEVTENPVFIREHDRLQRDSEILNNNFGVFPDKKNLEILMKELLDVKIPAVESELFELEMDFERSNIKRANLGREELTCMPLEIQEKKYRLLAKLDILSMEVDVLESKIKNFTDKEESKQQSDILAFGPRCSIQLQNNRIYLIDGQRVAENEDGIEYIAEGPYAGLCLQDYRRLSDKYLKERLHAQQNKLIRLQAEQREQGIPISKHLPVKSIGRVDPSSLPKRPSDAVDYMKKQVTAK